MLQGEVILVGRLVGEGGRRLCWANALLEPFDGSAPLQLLHLQEALQRQQLQLQQWQISRLQRHTPAPDAVLFSGMVIAVKGRLQQVIAESGFVLSLLFCFLQDFYTRFKETGTIASRTACCYFLWFGLGEKNMIKPFSLVALFTFSQPLTAVRPLVTAAAAVVAFVFAAAAGRVRATAGGFRFALWPASFWAAATRFP